MRIWLWMSLVVLAGIAVLGQEKADLTVPVPRTSYEVAEVTMTRLPRWSIAVTVMDNFGVSLRDVHQDAEAEALVKALNKADLSVKSLERRVLEHLIAEGKIPPATITGVPR